MLINTTGALKKNTDTEVISSSFKTQAVNSVLSKLYGLDVTDSIEPTFTIDSITMAPVPESTDTMTFGLSLTTVDLSSSQFHNLQVNDGDTLTQTLSLTSLNISASQFHNLQVNDSDTFVQSLALTSIAKRDILVIHHQHAVDTLTQTLVLTSVVKS